MKANELRDFIRPLIQEEVKKQLPKLLFEILGAQTNNKQVVQESARRHDPADDPIEPTSTPVYRQQFKPAPIPQKMAPVQPKKLKQYVKDPKLNAILNETTPLQQTSLDTGVDLGAVGFNKIGVSDEFMGEMRTLMNEGYSPEEEHYAPPVAEPVEETPESKLTNLFNKDFSAILKKSMSGNHANTGRVTLG